MKVAKWGNSLAIRIPKDVAEALTLAEGVEVELSALSPGVLGIARRLSREEALERLRKFEGRMPADYKFDRDEANAR